MVTLVTPVTVLILKEKMCNQPGYILVTPVTQLILKEFLFPDCFVFEGCNRVAGCNRGNWLSATSSSPMGFFPDAVCCWLLVAGCWLLVVE